MQRCIRLGSRVVSYELERKSVKNINLRVRSNGSVYVSANARVPVAEIESFIVSNADFVCRALDRCQRLADSAAYAQRLNDGDTMRLFGRDITLRLRRGTPVGVTETDDAVVLTVADPTDLVGKQRVLSKWLRLRLEQTVTAYCKAVYPVFSQYGVDFPQVKFRNMRSRWGSCNPSRKIVTFNYALVAAPFRCIEYVVVHEFCHFLHPDHSRAFRACLTSILPDWKSRKKLLNSVCTTK